MDNSNKEFEILFNSNEYYKPLKEWYDRNVVTVAKDLLGSFIIKKQNRKYLSGKIVEVEAYSEINDEASHSYKGISKRNFSMFEEGGILYVYFIYGVYFCANIVTGKKNIGDAVLIRAVEPIIGIEQMTSNRFNKKTISEKEKINLTNGPGKFCSAFAINREDDFVDLTGNNIFILKNKNKSKDKIVTTTRIGITKSKELKRRFFIKDNPFVSKK